MRPIAGLYLAVSKFSLYQQLNPQQTYSIHLPELQLRNLNVVQQ